MPINFGQYVYKPHPLQDWNIGQGIADLRAAQREQARMNETKRHSQATEAEATAGRQDLDTQFAANFAAARNKEEQERLLARYTEQKAAVQAGRESALAGQYNDARAQGARASELGGSYEESPSGDPKHPNFRFKAGDYPNASPIDVQGTRNSIFGGGAPGQPFMMRSPFGGNPADSLPGMSAAQLPRPPSPQAPVAPTPQQTAAPQQPGPVGSAFDSYAKDYNNQIQGLEAAMSGPQIPAPQLQFNGSQQLNIPQGPPLPYGVPQNPPGTIGGVPGPADQVGPVEHPFDGEHERPDAEVLADPAAAVGDPETEAAIAQHDAQQAALGKPGADEQQASAEQAPLQLTPPNPFGTPAFDPYRINTGDITRENTARLQGFTDSLKTGVPSDYKSRITPFANSISEMGYDPGSSIKLMQPTFETLASLMRADMNSQAAKASLGLRGQMAQNTMSERIQGRVQRHVLAASEKFKLTDNKDRFRQVTEAQNLLGMVSPQADRAAIGMVRDLYERGIMTDADFEGFRHGASRTWLQALKEKTFESLFANGIDGDARRNLQALCAKALESKKDAILQAQEQLLGPVRNNRTFSPEEREMTLNEVAVLIPVALWDPMVAEAMGQPLPQKSGAMDAAGNYPVKPAKKPAGGERQRGDDPEEEQLLKDLAGSAGG